MSRYAIVIVLLLFLGAAIRGARAPEPSGARGKRRHRDGRRPVKLASAWLLITADLYPAREHIAAAIALGGSQ
jgi:hypothetical protein